jgi:hypothetical protein
VTPLYRSGFASPGSRCLLLNTPLRSNSVSSTPGDLFRLGPGPHVVTPPHLVVRAARGLASSRRTVGRPRTPSRLPPRHRPAACRQHFAGGLRGASARNHGARATSAEPAGAGERQGFGSESTGAAGSTFGPSLLMPPVPPAARAADRSSRERPGPPPRPRGRRRGSGCWPARRPRPPEATDRSRRAPQALGLTIGPSRFAAAPVPAEGDREDGRDLDDDRDRDEDAALAARHQTAGSTGAPSASTRVLSNTLGAMDLAAALGGASERDADEVQELVVRLKKMLRALRR